VFTQQWRVNGMNIASTREEQFVFVFKKRSLFEI